MIAFSVAVTDASSRNIRLPRSAARRHPVFVRRDFDLCPEGLQGQEMRVDPAAADGVAARLGHRDLAAARQQRPGEQNRGPDLRRELAIGIPIDLSRGVDADDVRIDALDGCAELLQNLQHHPHVLDVGQVADDDRLVGQQTGGQDRQAPRSCSRPAGSFPPDGVPPRR